MSVPSFSINLDGAVQLDDLWDMNLSPNSLTWSFRSPSSPLSGQAPMSHSLDHIYMADPSLSLPQMYDPSLRLIEGSFSDTSRLNNTGSAILESVWSQPPDTRDPYIENAFGYTSSLPGGNEIGARVSNGSCEPSCSQFLRNKTSKFSVGRLPSSNLEDVSFAAPASSPFPGEQQHNEAQLIYPYDFTQYSVVFNSSTLQNCPDVPVIPATLSYSSGQQFSPAPLYSNKGLNGNQTSSQSNAFSPVSSSSSPFTYYAQTPSESPSELPTSYKQQIGLYRDIPNKWREVLKVLLPLTAPGDMSMCSHPPTQKLLMHWATCDDNPARARIHCERCGKNYAYHIDNVVRHVNKCGMRM